MTIQDIIVRRGIREILHFTTNQGITGILATGYLKARRYLQEEKYLEYIYKYNCAERQRDEAWWGYVNMSITSVNRRLFDISTGKWHVHGDHWWSILSFSPKICCHDGVYFTTTNNMYTSVKRQQGPEGLENMFAASIVQWPAKIIKRQSSTQENQPTCDQAEVLYPKEISLDYLVQVYVANNENAAKFDSIKCLFPNWSNVQCLVRDDLF